MARIIGLGLTLIRDNELEQEPLNNGFIVKKFSVEEYLDKESKNNVLANKINKEKIETKTKIEENKKELPPLPNINKKEKIETKTKIEEKKKELPPLPNIKTNDNIQTNKKVSLDNKEKLDIKEKNTDKKAYKSFKMDKSFLKDD